MFAYLAYRGYPTYSGVVQRRRLTRLMGSAGDTPIVLAAPSGLGKTVASAHFASSQPLPVLWISASGTLGTNPDVYTAVAAAFSPDLAEDAPNGSEEEMIRRCRIALSEHCPHGVLVVLDDFGEASRADALSAALACFEPLRHCRVQLLVSTRQTAEQSSRALVIGACSLAFTPVEVSEAAALLGRSDLSANDFDEVLRSCSGHPALTMTVLAGLRPGHDVAAGPGEARAIARRISEEHLTGPHRRLLDALRLFKRASTSELESLGVRAAEDVARTVISNAPLITRESFSGTDEVLVAHDLICDHLSGVQLGRRLAELQLDPAVSLSVLAAHHDTDRLWAFLVARDLQTCSANWLAGNGDDALLRLGHSRIVELLSGLPLGLVVGSAPLMQLWTRALFEMGRIEESIAKARVALALASHERNLHSVAVVAAFMIRSLAVSHRAEEALKMGNDLARQLEHLPDKSMLCEVLAATEVAACILDRESEIDWIAKRVELTESAGEGVRRAVRKMETTRACRIGFKYGDWRRMSNVLLPMINSDGADDLVTRVKRRGNAASCLVECGRLNRANSLLESILDRGSEYADGAYLPVRGMLSAALGQVSEGIEIAMSGMRISLAGGDELDVAHDRLYLAIMQRSAGQADESLVSSERAYEGFSRTDFAGLRRLAATEVAASLLALDDCDGCRAWFQPVVDAGFGENSYQALRAAMVFAECDRRHGQLESGVSRLVGVADEARSENSNWQMAMYVRTFPHLLGMLAMASGARNLPSHMLRMILPENVERSLRLAHSFMDRDEWMILGRRALGEERFAEYLERKGRPLCRVRLFGGLEVSTDERVIRERDWAKRKARAMFAMLVLLRGQEVSRDLILDQLWPDMDPPRAKNNFYVAWSAMKSALVPPEQRDSPCPYVESSRGRCRMVRDWVRSDVDDFEDLIAKARSAEAEGKTQEALSAYSDLASVYRGDLLPGDLYDDWFGPYRDKYRFEFIDAMVRATELLLDVDDPWEAQIYIRRAVGIDPFREDLYQVALRCHISAGQRSAAIETFIQCKAQLSDELGLDPSASTLALYQQVLAMEERPRTEGYGLSGLGSEYLLD